MVRSLVAMATGGFQPRLGHFLYEELADYLASEIDAGRLSGRLPGAPHLAAQYGVARVTAQRAVAILRERGLVFVTRPLGTFVVPPEERS